MPSEPTTYPDRPFVDIHCHLMPGIDDGSKSWEQTALMAELACEDGTGTIVMTPHQLGNFGHNLGDDIRYYTGEVQEFLNEQQIPLKVLPGGDVRIEDGMVRKILAGEVMTLADQGKHVLLELPHELYFPLEPILDELQRNGMQGILSHPERNHGLLQQPQLLPMLVDYGCLMQVTSGSLVGGFGPASQQLAESMMMDGLVHFLASDGHSHKSRRPRMGRSFQKAAEMVGVELATELCCDNPLSVVQGAFVEPGRRSFASSTTSSGRGFGGWFSRRAA